MRRSLAMVTLLALTARADGQEPTPYQRLARSSVKVTWDSVDFPEAMQELSAIVGVPIVVLPELADRGEVVDLTWTRGRALSLLRVLARRHDIHFLLEDGALIATTPEEAIRRTAVVKIYDVRGTVFPLTDFIAPELGLGRREFDEPPPREVIQEGVTEDDLVTVLQNATGNDSWDHEGVSIQSTHGRIIVRHTPSMHRRIERILRVLGKL